MSGNSIVNFFKDTYKATSLFDALKAGGWKALTDGSVGCVAFSVVFLATAAAQGARKRRRCAMCVRPAVWEVAPLERCRAPCSRDARVHALRLDA